MISKNCNFFPFSPNIDIIYSYGIHCKTISRLGLDRHRIGDSVLGYFFVLLLLHRPEGVPQGFCRESVGEYQLWIKYGHRGADRERHQGPDKTDDSREYCHPGIEYVFLDCFRLFPLVGRRETDRDRQ